ncbi:MAG: 1-deoxy-D-xylulose-5-phosphate reductoisomerase [Bacteroidales bacterium]|jgi:1-deoxy-D-xylulose-5-phosphate reductoisomerase|nr:1-deoxy-D-xylulose-5-phosphate reductoisomerase [Bacteroidales bacterium]
MTHTESKKTNVAILGSTGSIGTQSLEVIKQHQDKFQVEVLTACRNSQLLIKQATELKPNAVVIADETKYEKVKEALEPHFIKVFAGTKSLEDVVTMESIDVIVMALVGYSGLKPTYNAVKANKRIALANKEVLVVGGELIMNLLQNSRASIYPVDSEHSAIFQCLVGESFDTIEKLILTASGGPFRNLEIEKWGQVTPEQALKHPNWCMGDKVTIDSATMMNKGLEVIEAYWLFGVPIDNIEVLIHPQSIVHSMVQFNDGSVKAQLGIPDMKLPIQYALSYPQRIKLQEERLDLAKIVSLDFEEVDTDKFRNLKIAINSIKKGGLYPCAMNAANEIAVDAFLNNRLNFAKIPDLIEQSTANIVSISGPTIDDYFEMDKEIRHKTNELIIKGI